jgi:DNA polymerase alpha-associated DNA helicase A
MSRALIEYSNKYFYDNKILSLHESEVKFKEFFDGPSLIFVDTFECYFNEAEDKNSKFNREEGEIIKRYLNYLEDIGSKMSVGVIAPYSSQVVLIEEIINEKYSYDLKISTVDNFQGQERAIIVISMVRSNDENDIGFMSEIRRMNVAITRCRKGLFIVGDSSTFRCSNFFKMFF